MVFGGSQDNELILLGRWYQRWRKPDGYDYIVIDTLDVWELDPVSGWYYHLRL